ncbi:hypothetical protein HYV80_02370 [Candidatus Woesearchaeota archaeon]|nr:hypothetical protein [Candidatus Woesearchaeota archaeon]
MSCERCKKNLETREFDGRNLCYDCAIKEYPPKKLDFLYSKSVKYKFSKTQEELDEEEDYVKLADSIISKFKNQFEDGDIEGILNGVKVFLKSKLIESEYFHDNFLDFFMNDFRDGIYTFLKNKKILDSGKLDELSKSYVKIYSLMGEPPPQGLAHNVRGYVLDQMDKIEEAFEEYLNSLKIHLDNIESGDEVLFMNDLIYSWGRVKRVLTYFKKLPEKLEAKDRLLEEYTKYIRESKPKEKEFTSIMINPDKPYTNIMHLLKTIRECEDFIDWFDPYFTINGFEVLTDAENENIKRIRILSGIKQTNEKLRNRFSRLKEELSKKGVDVQFRVLIGKSIQDLHDRWIISKNKKFNVPSLNTIYRGQYSEIKETTNDFPFEKYWNEGKDLINEWDVIDKYLQNREEN